MIDKRICFSRPLMTTLFQLWQCPRLTWLFQVCAVFSPFSVVVPPVASLVNANIKVFSLLAAGSGYYTLHMRFQLFNTLLSNREALLAKWAGCSVRIILSFSDPSTSSHQLSKHSGTCTCIFLKTCWFLLLYLIYI